MRTFLKQNAVFLSLSLILFIVLGLVLLFVPKGELHLWLCDRHAPARDIFYRYYTRIAEWFPYVICVLVLLFGRVGDGVMASACMIVSSLTTQLFKYLVAAPRPLTWFAENMPDVQLPLVEGVRMNYYLSFPSGHTTSFFALAFVLSVIVTKSLYANNSNRICSVAVQLLLFIAAALGAYSRIYLSQHFALDVFAGIGIGLSVSLLCYAVFAHYSEQNWYNYHFFAKKMK
jgi:membrane-associated phospholipid phosphatase